MKRMHALWVAAIFVMLAATSVSAAAQTYASLVARVSQALNVPGPLVHAVIDAESDYRADVVSHAGAVGLMQLIPKYGARESYKYLYKLDRIPTNQALKRPEVSIWLGTAYLHILDTRYFAWIKNKAVRLRAVIAAYNWGPTAVLKSIFPDRNASISVTQFMRDLKAKAPGQTQAYVAQVLDSMHANRVAGVRVANNP